MGKKKNTSLIKKRGQEVQKRFYCPDQVSISACFKTSHQVMPRKEKSSTINQLHSRKLRRQTHLELNTLYSNGPTFKFNTPFTWLMCNIFELLGKIRTVLD